MIAGVFKPAICIGRPTVGTRMTAGGMTNHQDRRRAAPARSRTATRIDRVGLLDFREETIYFLLTARFYNGDPSSNFFCRDHIRFDADSKAIDSHWRGDFKRLIQRLDYIRDLGGQRHLDHASHRESFWPPTTTAITAMTGRGSTRGGAPDATIRTSSTLLMPWASRSSRTWWLTTPANTASAARRGSTTCPSNTMCPRA